MKKLLFMFIYLLQIGSMEAQPTLTGATNNPQPGNISVVYSCKDGPISIGSGGANMTWDYSNLQIDDSVTSSYKACSAIPVCGLFTGSNVALEYGIYEHEFWRADASKYSFEGYFGVLAKTVYTDPKDFLRYPFTFNSSFNDTFVADIDDGSEFLMGSCVVTADAYGTLKLPDGTITNTLRVHRAEIGTDSIVGGTVEKYKTDWYTWYTPGVPTPLLRIATGEVPIGATPDTIVQLFKRYPTGVNEVANRVPVVEIYPNPSDGNITIKVLSNKTDKAELTITNMFGEVVANQNIFTNQSMKIQLSQPSGIYIVNVKVNGVSNIQKLIITK